MDIKILTDKIENDLDNTSHIISLLKNDINVNDEIYIRILINYIISTYLKDNSVKNIKMKFIIDNNNVNPTKVSLFLILALIPLNVEFTNVDANFKKGYNLIKNIMDNINDIDNIKNVYQLRYHITEYAFTDYFDDAKVMYRETYAIYEANKRMSGKIGYFLKDRIYIFKKIFHKFNCVKYNYDNINHIEIIFDANKKDCDLSYNLLMHYYDLSKIFKLFYDIDIILKVDVYNADFILNKLKIDDDTDLFSLFYGSIYIEYNKKILPENASIKSLKIYNTSILEKLL